MQVEHRFVNVLKEDGGKEHLFTWNGDEGNHLFYAMYQSGDDRLEPENAESPQRGRVLRIQTKEKIQDASLTSSLDAEKGTLRFIVDDEGWQAQDYQEVAKTVLTNLDFTHEQQTAMLCQLASLYNLMATQYGKVFTLPLANAEKNSLKQLVTDPKLQAVSQWFKELAETRLRGKAVDIESLPLEIPEPAKPSKPSDPAPLLYFSHGILAEAGSKLHDFTLRNYEGKELLRAEYQSGRAGESILITYPVAEGKMVTIPYNFFVFSPEHEREGLQYSYEGETFRDGRAHMADKALPVAASYQLEKLHFYTKLYGLTPAQQAATLVMLGSATNLMATRYQRGFKSLEIDDATTLESYIRTKEPTATARELLNHAATLLQGQTIDYPPLGVTHDYLEGVDPIKSLPLGKTLDVSLVPPLDHYAILHAGAASENPVPGLIAFSRNYQLMRDLSTGFREVSPSQQRRRT